MIPHAILLYFTRRKSCNGEEFENIANLPVPLISSNWFIKTLLISLTHISFTAKLGAWKLK